MKSCFRIPQIWSPVRFWIQQRFTTLVRKTHFWVVRRFPGNIDEKTVLARSWFNGCMLSFVKVSRLDVKLLSAQNWARLKIQLCGGDLQSYRQAENSAHSHFGPLPPQINLLKNGCRVSRQLNNILLFSGVTFCYSLVLRRRNGSSHSLELCLSIWAKEYRIFSLTHLTNQYKFYYQ